MESSYGNSFRPKIGYVGNIDNHFCFPRCGSWHWVNHFFYYRSPPGSIRAGQPVMGYCWSQVTTALSPSHSVMLPVTGACSDPNGFWTYLSQVGTDGNMFPPLLNDPRKKGPGWQCNMLGHLISYCFQGFFSLLCLTNRKCLSFSLSISSLTHTKSHC